MINLKFKIILIIVTATFISFFVFFMGYTYREIIKLDFPQQNVVELMSWGNKNLLKENKYITNSTQDRNENKQFTFFKDQGVKNFEEKDYTQAVKQFKEALKIEKNAPETLIYLNNARIAENSNQANKAYTIAVVVPISSDPNVSLEILRGVAQAQDEVKDGGINQKPLKVMIADDSDQPEVAKQVAAGLVKEAAVLGVVGHNSSAATLEAGVIYTEKKLVAISPISTAVNLSTDKRLSSDSNRYVFRTVPNDRQATKRLSDYILKKLKDKNKLKKAVVFFNSKSIYSKSLRDEFVNAFESKSVVDKVDLFKPGFSAFKEVENAIKQGAEVLMLAPNTDVLCLALQVVQANKLSQKPLNLLGGDDVYALMTLEIGREAAVGMVVAVPWHDKGDPQLDFIKYAKSLWGEVGLSWRTALAYDATKALIEAIKKNPTRTGIQKILSSEKENFSVEGASGTISFSSSGDRDRADQLVKIVPGQRSGTDYDFELVEEE